MGGLCLFGLAILCFIIGFIQLVAPEPAMRGQIPVRNIPGQVPLGGVPRPSVIDPSLSGVPRPAFLDPRIPGTISGLGSVSQTTPQATSTASGGGPVNMNEQKLSWIKVGQRIYTRHAVKGELMSHVLGRIVYAELWQQSRGPQVPWTPTGNAFIGFWLEGGMFLLNWQNRFYLLDERVELSDADIQRDFLPHARKFAQSDQTADVYFAYPPAMWHIDDIGKFNVTRTEGEGLLFRSGAVGRFIHASGDSGRALVVEDYEGGGGGQDTAWIGYSLAEEDIKPT